MNTQPAPVNFSRLKILVVEDNHHMRRIITAILNGAGVPPSAIREAKDGIEALELLRQFDADLALIDYNMSPIDGVEFARIMRNAPDSANRYLPLVMITGHSEKSRVTQARDAGVNEFIIKPLTAKALLNRIVSIVLKPRVYIRSSTYFGPDRRRRATPNYPGPFRRDDDGLL